MKTILLYIFIVTNLLYGQTEEIFIPYSKNITILDPLNITYFNSVEYESFQYIVHNSSINNIKNHYKRKFSRIGYKIEQEDQISIKSIKIDHMKFSGQGRIITVMLSIKDKNDVIVHLINSDEALRTDVKSFKLNSRKDNPGFDLKDIPRPAKSIRIISLANSGKSKIDAFPGNDVCNLIYRSKSSKPNLAAFYLTEMKKYKWVPSYDKNFFHNDMGYWMTYNKGKKTCLISILYSKEFKSNVVSVYYGYK